MPKNTGHPLFDVVNTTVVAAFGEPEKFTLTLVWPDGSSDVVPDLDGIFDARHYVAEVGGEVGVSEYSASLACRRDAVPESLGGNAGHTVTVRGTVYGIVDKRPDSEGWVVLVLSEEDGQ